VHKDKTASHPSFDGVSFAPASAKAGIERQAWDAPRWTARLQQTPESDQPHFIHFSHLYSHAWFL